jgi:uncharacterized membrane protein
MKIMKISTSIVVLVIIIGFFFIQSSPVNQSVKKSGSIYTAEAKKVIDEKCYGCHSVKGKSQDAKDALMWDSMPNLQKSKLVATLDDIIGVLKENTMPPEDVIKKYPEMKLLPQEKKILLSWAESKADSLLK